VSARAGTAELETTDSDTGTTHGWRVVLFNCDCHTFDQVEAILIKATHCSIGRARQLSTEVHTKGSAVVYSGARERCEAVADVIGSIGLLVNVLE